MLAWIRKLGTGIATSVSAGLIIGSFIAAFLAPIISVWNWILG